MTKIDKVSLVTLIALIAYQSQALVVGGFWSKARTPEWRPALRLLRITFGMIHLARPGGRSVSEIEGNHKIYKYKYDIPYPKHMLM